MRGNFGGANMKNILQQAQKMQAQMEKAQQDLAAMEIEAVVGGGAVKAVVNGAKEVLRIEIDPAVADLDPEDAAMLEDLLVAAVNEALSRAEDMSQEAMGKITGGIKGLM